jgi:hypothetical protein
MASLVLSGDTSGSITVSAPAVSGSNTQTLVATTGTLAPIVSGTAVASTSGTAIEFTGIPSWVKRITVMFSAVSTNGTNNILVQLGSGSYTTSGYGGSFSRIQGSTATTGGAITVGFAIASINASTDGQNGSLVLTNLSGNTWTACGAVFSVSYVAMQTCAGAVGLSGTLDRVRIIGSATGSPTDTFDAGTINILYE